MAFRESEPTHHSGIRNATPGRLPTMPSVALSGIGAGPKFGLAIVGQFGIITFDRIMVSTELAGGVFAGRYRKSPAVSAHAKCTNHRAFLVGTHKDHGPMNQHRLGSDSELRSLSPRPDLSWGTAPQKNHRIGCPIWDPLGTVFVAEKWNHLLESLARLGTRKPCARPVASEAELQTATLNVN